MRGRGETPQALAPRRLTTHPAESEYCSGNQTERQPCMINTIFP
ncbi:hypothetical protein J2S19_003141 [Metabacillus malikii]|uniref:Uncharacterized protein n=1 Tax=Metabacillus malikii TaxID=1504265 RepID=A0ABT9ZHV2_9BACI|nr:hypothetical protein [Metabacillus malikii]